MKNLTKSLPITAACLCLTFILIFSSITTAQAKSAANQDPTEYLKFTLEEMGRTPEGGYSVDYTYSEELKPNGLEYVFTMQQKQCYALMISYTDAVGNVYYEITELFFDSVSPFNTARGKKIYVNTFTYFDYADDTYTDLKNGEAFTQEQIDKIAESGFKFYGADDPTVVTEQINYSRKTTTSGQIPYGLPAYTHCSFPDACAPKAGGVLIGYYDALFPSLIPDFDSLITFGNGSAIFRPQTDEITAVIDQLYIDMETTEGGTTYWDFQSGFTAYANRRGRSVKYMNIIYLSQFDFSAYKSRINSGKPIALFLSAYNISMGAISPPSTPNQDSVSYAYYENMHVMVGGGYMEINYYDSSDTVFRSDRYLSISTGLPGMAEGYMRVYDNEQIDYALVVDMY